VQQRVVGGGVGGVPGHCTAEAGQQALQVADVVIDLGCSQARLVDRALDRGGLVMSPLIP